MGQAQSRFSTVNRITTRIARNHMTYGTYVGAPEGRILSTQRLFDLLLVFKMLAFGT